MFSFIKISNISRKWNVWILIPKRFFQPHILSFMFKSEQLLSFGSFVCFHLILILFYFLSFIHRFFSFFSPMYIGISFLSVIKDSFPRYWICGCGCDCNVCNYGIRILGDFAFKLSKNVQRLLGNLLNFENVLFLIGKWNICILNFNSDISRIFTCQEALSYCK